MQYRPALIKERLCSGKSFVYGVLQDHSRCTLCGFGSVAAKCSNHRGAPMLNLRCLLLAVAAGAAISPAALAHADGGFSDDDLTLTAAGPDVPYTTLGPDGYVGFQPLFTEWQQYQPTNVEIGGTTVGTYNVFETDYATPWTDESLYNFGSATSGGT